jgi:hypothetical protein
LLVKSCTGNIGATGFGCGGLGGTGFCGGYFVLGTANDCNEPDLKVFKDAGLRFLILLGFT